jgi:hypothetical protein
MLPAASDEMKIGPKVNRVSQMHSTEFAMSRVKFVIMFI